VLCLSGLGHAANTVQDFSAIFPETSGTCENPPPILPIGDVSILPYWDGQGVQLTPDVGSLSTGIALPQLISGDYSSLEIEFQFQIFPAANAGADGIGFLYANSAEHGVDNCALFPDWGTGEEPNLVGSLGVGFDNYNNGAMDGDALNSVSLHWNGAPVGQAPLTDFDNPLFLESGDTIQANIVVTPSGTGSNVSVALVDLDSGDSFVAFEDHFVEGLQPYNGRPVFKARTGGESAEQSIDNLSIKLTPAGGGDPLTVTENFESYPEGLIDVDAPPIAPNPPLVGGTPYTEFQGGPDPPVRLINDGPGPGAQPGHMRLTPTVNSLLNSIAFDQTSDVADNIQASFKMLMQSGGVPADGISFLILDANTYGDSGELNAGFSEEPNLAGALAIGFDNYDNGELGAANHVSLHWDGVQVGENVALDPAEFPLVSGDWHDVQVIATEVEGGMNVTLVMTNADGTVVTPFLDEFVEGASFPDGARAAFGARTGGLNAIQSIDDVLISWTGGGLIGDFNLNGVLDLPDINDLTGQSASGANNATYDLNSDALVNEADIGVWINDLYNSWLGDANLDGQFNSSDLVSVLASGTYETGADSVWGTGDFNGDGLTTSGDLVTALAGGGYEMGPRAAVAAVPEPAGCTLLLLGCLMLLGRRR
jgi:hypothetical protein